MIEELRPKLARVPGVRVVLSNPPAIRIGGTQSRAHYQFTLQDPDTDELYRVAPGLRGGAARRAGTARRQLDLQIRNPELAVDLDREQIAALGLTVDQVESALSSAYSSRQVSQIFAPNDEYQVIMQVAPEYQQDPAALSMLYVQAPGGKLVPLSAVVTHAPERRAAVDQPHRPAAVGHAVVQHRAGRGARRRGRAGSAARARDAARHRVRQLPGHGAGLPGLAARPRAGSSRWRSSSSTSCSASSTRASSTR